MCGLPISHVSSKIKHSTTYPIRLSGKLFVIVVIICRRKTSYSITIMSNLSLEKKSFCENNFSVVFFQGICNFVRFQCHLIVALIIWSIQDMIIIVLCCFLDVLSFSKEETVKIAHPLWTRQKQSNAISKRYLFTLIVCLYYLTRKKWQPIQYVQ